MGLFDFIFGKKKITLDEANKVNEDFIRKNPTPKDEENALVRKASSLLTSRNFEASIEVYQQLAEKFPENKGLYLSQIGANYFFMQSYEKALQIYIEALQAGAHKDMMDDNIWEVCEVLYKQSQDKGRLTQYLSLFPAGSHSKKAQSLLNSHS